MLSTDIQSPDELMSIALQAEREAIRRYTELAEIMTAGGNQRTAALFQRMVEEERGHEKLLQQWMQQEGIRFNEAIGPIRWRDPNVNDTYREEARSPDHSTPYRALAFAVHNEEIAFRFYTQVAAESKNARVREYAEVLAHEELGHAALLRAERRRAYHQERQEGENEPTLEAGMIQNRIDLLRSATVFDTLLLHSLQALQLEAPEADALIRQIQDSLSAHQQLLQNEAIPDADGGDQLHDRLEAISQYNRRCLEKLDDLQQKLQQLFACCERLFAFYDALVGATDDESVMLTAQQLSAGVLERIALLRNLLDDPAG